MAEREATKGMMQNRRLAQALAGAGIPGFPAKLAHKCRWFPSSTMCVQCGDRNDSLTSSDRRWVCPNCEAENERDPNAALKPQTGRV